MWADSSERASEQASEWAIALSLNIADAESVKLPPELMESFRVHERCESTAVRKGGCTLTRAFVLFFHPHPTHLTSYNMQGCPSASVCTSGNAITRAKLTENGLKEDRTKERTALHGVTVTATHLNCPACMGNYGHGWSSATAFLPDQSLCGRSSWSWKQWQAPAARSSAHRQWHTGTLLFFPTHLLACWSDQSSR